jgi:hypothetical protein
MLLDLDITYLYPNLDLAILMIAVKFANLMKINKYLILLIGKLEKNIRLASLANNTLRLTS